MNQLREQTISRLFSLNARGIKYDLSRMLVAVARLGNPHHAYSSFHVAGTNGKGSTCAYIDSIMRTAGHRVGLYTSPHIVSFEERFIIQGIPAAADAWLGVFEEIEPVVTDLNLTFFEIATLIAFELFKRERVAYAVFETGLGGRFDATNVVLPAATIITSLGIDHAEYLGPDLRSIAGEKLGIVKQGVPHFMARPADPSIEAFARDVAKERRTSVTFIDESLISSVSEAAAFYSFTHEGNRYRLPLAGRHQIVNALAAIAACRSVGVDKPENLTGGIGSASLPGRFQVVDKGTHQVVFDVAHNPQAADILARALAERFSDSKIVFVFGAMKDKDIAGVLEPLAPLAKHFLFTTPATDRACKAAELPRFLAQKNQPAYRIVEPVAAAVDMALSDDASNIVCICGSFFTVGEAMTALGISPFKTVCD